MTPKVTIYAAGEVLAEGQRAGAVAVLLSGENCKAVGGTQAHATDQEAQVAACRLGLDALKQSCEVEMHVALEVVAQMCADSQALAVLSYTDYWMGLRKAAERHNVTWRAVRRFDSPRMAAVCFAARELALAGAVVPGVLDDAREAVLTGRGLMQFSPLRKEVHSWSQPPS